MPSQVIVRGVLCCAIVTLCACDSSSVCKRACRRIEACESQLAGQGSGTSSPAPVKGTSSSMLHTLATACGGETVECSADDVCAADCVADASCSDLFAWSGDLQSCIARCEAEDDDNTKPAAPKGDAGVLHPVGPQGCQPSCVGKECGSDGCTGTCGTCGYGETCSYGTCVSSSPPAGSGAICDPYVGCSLTGEVCMLFKDGATHGMCLSACTTGGEICPSASGQFAACSLQDINNKLYCAFFCEGGGQSFSCPNSYDYTCEVFDPTVPDVKLCIPK